jgi:hypothetical protein
MKKTFVLSAAAILAVAVLVFTGCSGNSPSDPPPDTTAPTITNAAIENAAPSSLVVTFSEQVTAASAEGFSVSGSTAATSITGVSGSGTTTLTFTLNGNAAYGEAITLSYNGVSGNVADAAGNALATFDAQAVINNIDTTSVKAPVIDVQPTNTGSPYEFNASATALSVTVNGTSGEGDLDGDLTYQWYTTSSGSVYDTTSPIGSATGATYTPLTTASGTLYYYVKVTSTNNTATGTKAKDTDSSIVAITVEEATNVKAPAITVQPVNTGSPYAFEALANQLSVTADDTSGEGDLDGTLTYQWYTTSSDSAYDTTNPIGSATGATYTPLTTASGTLYYYVKVTSTNNTATGTKSKDVDSSIVAITVNEAAGTGKVVIEYWVSDITDATLATNTGSATLSRDAAETASITAATTGYTNHQWTLNGIDVTGAEGTASSYTFDSAGKGNGNYFIGIQVQKGTGGANAPWYSTMITITVTD